MGQSTVYSNLTKAREIAVESSQESQIAFISSTQRFGRGLQETW